MKSGQLQEARVGWERGRGDLQGHLLPALPAFFPLQKCKEEIGMGRMEEADGGQVMGTGLGLAVRGRKTESRELGRWDQGTWGQGSGPSSRLPEGIRPSNPLPMCPTNQVTSISEVPPSGEGGGNLVVLSHSYDFRLSFQVSSWFPRAFIGLHCMPVLPGSCLFRATAQSLRLLRASIKAVRTMGQPQVQSSLCA